MIKISNRLKTVASLVSPGYVLADVGTDHGYVPIYLMERECIKRAIAMDINRGPLECAREHITLFGMGEYIETRLSDGVAALSVGEADSILVAGMGGGLVIHILEEGRAVCQAAEELILQPQSELEKVRQYLRKQGYETDAENMVAEDGKYYPMMRVHYSGEICEEEAVVFDLYGKGLLHSKHPVLLEYLKKEQTVLRNIYENLKKQPDVPTIRERLGEIGQKIQYNRQALDFYA